MKKIEKLSLNRLSKKELTLGEMNKVKGGNSCPCGCCYVGSGGSASYDNGDANCRQGLSSTVFCEGSGNMLC